MFPVSSVAFGSTIKVSTGDVNFLVENYAISWYQIIRCHDIKSLLSWYKTIIVMISNHHCHYCHDIKSLLLWYQIIKHYVQHVSNIILILSNMNINIYISSPDFILYVLYLFNISHFSILTSKSWFYIVCIVFF